MTTRATTTATRTATTNQQRIENLGPAERILQAVLTHVDHAYHGRPGIIATNGGPLPHWSPATFKLEGEPVQKLVYALDKVGKKTVRRRLGALLDDGRVMEGRQVVGEYRQPGLFREVVAHLYRQIAEVWKLDGDFAAHWASHAFAEEHRDFKCLLAAFMLVQDRKGDPVVEGGKVLFYDEDFRDVGEAMCLTMVPGQARAKGDKKGKGAKDAGKSDITFNAKMMKRVGEILSLPEVAAINRELGFGNSARASFLGRWPAAVQKWLRYREENPKMLEGLVAAGFRETTMWLARRVRYRPLSPKFFEILRWEQHQAPDGRRALAIGQEMAAGETWQGLDERQICERIVRDRPGYKRLTGLLPQEVGLTRAIMAAAIEVGSVSGKDLIILTPTLEDLGLLSVPDVKQRWQAAVDNADNTRAAHIAERVKSQAVKDTLTDGADAAIKRAIEEVARDMRFYFIVDTSGSMKSSIEVTKRVLPQFLQAFPLERLHVAVFNTSGRVVEVKHASAKGVENAFRGIAASGGTCHGAGVRALAPFKTLPTEDAILFVVGDGGENKMFDAELEAIGLRPLAIAFLRLPGESGAAVEATAAKIGVPCAMIDESIFSDPYAITRTLKNLIASTPVRDSRTGAMPVQRRESLIERILKTPLLSKPAWA